MTTTKNQPLIRLRKRTGRLALCVAVLALVAPPPPVSAVILIEVVGPLILLEVEGLGFSFYSTSEKTRLRLRDTDTGRSGNVNLEGQREWLSELTLFAFSREDRNQKIRIVVDVSPLRGRATERLAVLDAWGVAVEPGAVTDPLLAELEGPLRLSFVLEWQTGDPDTFGLAVYRLQSVGRSELMVRVIESLAFEGVTSSILRGGNS